ncbi:hypothetical protein C8R43DRAFT_989975 [Mycena crocata]|nr:hypothetical protein C8R43DRAFT_989975 [Mycena crocata]
MAPMNILAVGASRPGNIGYYSAIRLLEKGATVTFLLRSPAVFDGDSTIQKFVRSGNVRLVKGDATNELDTKRAWDEAGMVDVLMFSVGGTPSFTLRGFVIHPHNLVTQCMLSILCTMPTYSDALQPKIVIVSGGSLTPAAMAALPLLLKPVYAMITVPRLDKLGMERVVSHCAGWSWDTAEPTADIMGGEDWMQRKGLPAKGSLKHVLIIRPALLTDGECVADKLAAQGNGKAPYIVSEDDLSRYTMSRKDAAHFLVSALNRWDEFENKRVNIAY